MPQPHRDPRILTHRIDRRDRFGTLEVKYKAIIEDDFQSMVTR